MSELSFKELKERIDKNDNRSTAKPYLLLLQVREKYVAHDDYSHNTETVHIHHLYGDVTESESKYEMVKDLFRNGYSKGEIENSIETLEVGFHWRTENIFLTDKGYQDHMELNSHNIERLGGHRTYGTHAFRNPEINKMFQAINKVVEQENEVLSLKALIIEATTLISASWTQCENTGMWSILKIDPSECECRFHKNKKFLEKTNALKMDTSG